MSSITLNVYAACSAINVTNDADKALAKEMQRVLMKQLRDNLKRRVSSSTLVLEGSDADKFIKALQG